MNGYRVAFGELRLLMAGLLVMLVGCNDGSSSGEVQNPLGLQAVGDALAGGGVIDSSEPLTLDAFFARSVQPGLANCRICHIPGGAADQDDGRALMLSATDSSSDYQNVFNAWNTLGKGVSSNRLLTMPSDPALRHAGSTPWPPSSRSFDAMKALLACWDNPASCALTDIVQEQLLPLLGSKHARHVWATYCEGEGESSAKLLPPDPRTLIQSGSALVQGDRAVFFNGWWEDCHADAPEAEQQPKTCGEYIGRRNRGEEFLKNELAGDTTSLDGFRNSWQGWGLSQRPANFDELYTLRYGLNRSPFENPYPLQGEDNLAPSQWSGDLPLGLRMVQRGGNWELATTACYTCHGGQIGDSFAGDRQLIGIENLGLGNNNYDVIMAAHDGSPFSEIPIVGGSIPAIDPNALFNVGIKQRGQNNAVGAFEFLNTILDLDSLGISPNPLKMMKGDSAVQDVSHPLAHTQDTPPWWNMGSRPRKFFDAGVSNDSTRIIMAAGPGEFAMLFSPDGAFYRNRIEEWDQDLEAFFLSLVSPKFPNPVDIKLAEQGAVLFHSKDLWAEQGNAGKPRPVGGNGSCASCHGAYSPRYVNDPAYLASPELEGVASHISPLAVIGTDSARADMLSPTLRLGWDTTFWAYPEGDPDYVAPESKDYLTETLDDMLPIDMRVTGACGWEKTVIGYQAPPLYGVWATAPYLHNGSVPTLEALLDSSKRSTIWQRNIQVENIGGVEIKGFDQSLAAYDFDNIGWKHRGLNCSEMPGSDELNCSPVDDEGPSMPQLVQNFLNSTLSWAGLVTIQDPAADGIDKRLVYDTRILGNGNGGHDFSDVLTEAERRAIIEYLKTL